MTVSVHQTKRAQRQWLGRRQTAQSSQDNNSIACPSWLTKAESEKFYRLYRTKVLPSPDYICFNKQMLFITFDWEATEKLRGEYLEQLLQQRLLQHKQQQEQNRHQQQKLKAQTVGRLSKTHSSAAHRARHERKHYRHQP